MLQEEEKIILSEENFELRESLRSNGIRIVSKDLGGDWGWIAKWILICCDFWCFTRSPGPRTVGRSSSLFLGWDSARESQATAYADSSTSKFWGAVRTLQCMRSAIGDPGRIIALRTHPRKQVKGALIATILSPQSTAAFHLCFPAHCATTANRIIPSSLCSCERYIAYALSCFIGTCSFPRTRQDSSPIRSHCRGIQPCL